MWNSTVPTTSRTRTTASGMGSPLLQQLGAACAVVSLALDAAEWVHEVAVDPDEFGLAMSFGHHRTDFLLQLPAGIDQDQEATGLDVVVEALELLVFAADADQSAFPGAEQRRDHHDRAVHHVRHAGAEGLEVPEQLDADQPGDEAEEGADEADPDHVEGLEVVGRMDVLLAQARLVLGNDVDVEIVDARRMQISGDLLGARQ